MTIMMAPVHRSFWKTGNMVQKSSTYDTILNGLVFLGKFEHSGCNTIFFPSIKLPEFITKLERVAVVGQEKSTISLQGKLYIMIKLLERGRSRLVTLTLQHTDYGMDALSEVVLDVPMGKQLFEGVKEIFLVSHNFNEYGIQCVLKFIYFRSQNKWSLGERRPPRFHRMKVLLWVPQCLKNPFPKERNQNRYNSILYYNYTIITYNYYWKSSKNLLILTNSSIATPKYTVIPENKTRVYLKPRRTVIRIILTRSLRK